MKNHTPRYWGFRFGVEQSVMAGIKSPNAVRDNLYYSTIYPSTGRPVILPEAMSYGAAFQKAQEFAQKLGEDYGQAISAA